MDETYLSKDPLVGRTLNSIYKIEEAIGAGGMGAVYRGTQLALSRNVAIKVLLPGLAGTADFRARFLREAKILSQLNHPNIVNVIDFGHTEDGLLFLVMEFLAGGTLAQRVAPGTGVELASAVAYMREMCDGVGAAHALGLVHRDLKPQNIFLTHVTATRDLVKILDFGLGKAGGERERLTATGMAMGTPSYISPEQIRNSADVDARADVYALGAIFHYLLSGRDPYDGDSATMVMMKQLQEPPQPIDFAGKRLPTALAPVLAKAMHLDREQRFASTSALLTAVVGASGRPAPGDATQATVVVPTPPATKPRRGLVAAAIAGAVLLAAVVGAEMIFSHHGSPAAPSTPHTVAPAKGAHGVTDTQLDLGMSAPFTGPASDLGTQMQLGIRCGLDEVNSAGGVNGRRVVLVSYDDGYEPGRTETGVEELLDQKKVFALVGNVGTPTTQKALPLARERKTILFGAMTGSGILRSDPPERYVFNLRASYAEETAAIVRHFLGPLKVPAEAIVVFAQHDAYGDSGYDGVAKQLRIAGYHGEVPRFDYARNTLDVEEAVKGILAAPVRPKGIVMVCTYAPGAKFIRLLRDAKLEAAFANVSFVGSRALADALMAAGPTYAQGVIVTQVVPPFDSDLPAAAAYRQAMEAKHSSDAPGFVGFEGYLAARVFTEAVRRAGRSLDTESLVVTLEEMEGYDPGIGTSISFSASDHQGLHRVWGTRIRADGRFEEIPLGR